MVEIQEEKKRGKYPHPVRTRVSITDYEKIVEAAETAGMSVGQYARHRLAGAHVSSKIEVRVLNELRRIGGLLKKMAMDGQPTAPALDELKQTLKSLQQQ